MDMEDEKRHHAGEIISALIFAYADPISKQDLAAYSGLAEEEVEKALLEIREALERAPLGFELVQVAGKYQLRTKSAFAPYLQSLKSGAPRRLSAAALETLAIVAYRQPVVRSEIEKIRGVDVTPTLKTLLERGLIKVVGNAPSVGQPALFGTTEEFLHLFGLNDLSELPRLKDFDEIERDPGESGLE